MLIQIKKANQKTARTNRSLLDALTNLLARRSFAKLTVNDICTHAHYSRTAFYAHFQDKYDLLKHYLSTLSDQILSRVSDLNQLEAFVNGYVCKNNRIISNILQESNDETLTIVKDFLAGLVCLSDRKGCGEARQRVYSNFCVGGMLSSLFWQVENRFPGSQPLMDKYFYAAISALKALDPS